MNILNKTKVYLCGHMQYLNGRGWREELTKELVGMGVTVFDPYHKPFVDDTNEDETVRAQLKTWMDHGEYDSGIFLDVELAYPQMRCPL